MKGVFAPPGTFIPGTGITLKVGEIRGVRSAGMLLSEREMGLGEDHAGIVDLPEDAPVGVPYAQWAGPRRSGDRCQRHAEPRRLLLGARHRARSCRRRHRHAEAVAAGEDRARVPRRPALADRLARGLPLDPRPHHPQPAQRTEPALAAGPADLDRPAADQRAGRHHQLLHHRSRPPAARVRRGEADRRRADAAPGPRRDVPRAERPRLHGRPPRTAPSPMPPACSRWPA